MTEGTVTTRGVRPDQLPADPSCEEEQAFWLVEIRYRVLDRSSAAGACGPAGSDVVSHEIVRS